MPSPRRWTAWFSARRTTQPACCPIVDCWRFFAGAVRTLPGQVAGEYLPGHTSMIRRDPIGIVASIAHQLHGAMGYSQEYPLHHRTRRLWAWRDAWVSQAEAEDTVRRLAREEGILAGPSSGGALAVALKLSEQLENAVIVSIVCDRGDRYLSTGLFPD